MLSGTDKSGIVFAEIVVILALLVVTSYRGKLVWYALLGKTRVDVSGTPTPTQQKTEEATALGLTMWQQLLRDVG